MCHEAEHIGEMIVSNCPRHSVCDWCFDILSSDANTQECMYCRHFGQNDVNFTNFNIDMLHQIGQHYEGMAAGIECEWLSQRQKTKRVMLQTIRFMHRVLSEGESKTEKIRMLGACIMHM